MTDRGNRMKKIICIGREYGSGGREIGEKLAAALGVPYYDKLLIKKTALESGLSEEYIARTEESPVKNFQFLSGNLYADMAVMNNTFYLESQITYNAEKKVIEQIGAEGCGVIVGRCASGILPEDKRLSVFIYAGKTDKINRVSLRNGISEKDAAGRIRRVDRMRRQFFDFYSETPWGQPESYDIMLSSSHFGIDGCVNILLNSIRSTEAPVNE